MPPETRVPPSYEAHPIESAEALRRLSSRLGPERLLATLKVNRLDLAHVRAGDTLLVPDSAAMLEALSPFPSLIPAATRHPKLILISRRMQAFALFEAGHQVRWGPTSTGRRESPTPVGLYHTNWKSKERISTIDEAWLLKWCVNIHSRNGISIHLYDLPGRPASHSCVRLLEDDARAVYDWCETWTLSADGRDVLRHGTPVIVFADYVWEVHPPWKRLAEEPKATTIPLDEVNAALRAHLPALGDSLAARSEPAGAWSRAAAELVSIR